MGNKGRGGEIRGGPVAAVRTETRLTKMKIAGLFAGIGGFELGMHQAGHETVLLCEIRAGSRAVLEKAFPGVRIDPDVRALGPIPREVDLICAGFPCQDLSQAGKTTGLSGK